MLYPEVLRKAHAELDTVVGPHRLPDFSDKDSLPYVNAVIKESMRWHSALPLGVPHATVADDEFRGYFIPAGTMLIPNTWYVAPCCHWSINGLLNIQLGRACMTPRYTRTQMPSGQNGSCAMASLTLPFWIQPLLSSDTVEGTSHIMLISWYKRSSCRVQNLSRTLLCGRHVVHQHRLRAACLRHRAASWRRRTSNEDSIR